MRIILLILLFNIAANAVSSSNPPDQGLLPENHILLIRNHQVDEYKILQHNDVRFLNSGSSAWFIRYNPVYLLMGGMMYAYQAYLSPQLPTDCFYEESCSGYSQKLIHRYGILGGIITTSDRLMRCNRLSAMEIHPLFINEKSRKVMDDIEIYNTQAE
jgi:putative component of membrane protein insertase Oxa1/YidC/SpoIIIJ protein YidD